MTWWVIVLICIAVILVLMMIFTVIGALAISSRISLVEEEKSDKSK